MSIFDVDAVFSYEFPTSSIEYIRNYNFNATTVTDLPLVLSNSGDVVPLTVDITSTDSWVKITGANGAEIRSAVVPPTGSVSLIVKIDLPPELENQSGSVVVRPNIFLDIKSGSVVSTSSAVPTSTGTTLDEEPIEVTPVGPSGGGENETPQQSFV